MISKGADVNGQNKHGETPLHQAAQRGRDQNVLFLLNNKANANQPNKYATHHISAYNIFTYTAPSASSFSDSLTHAPPK